MKKQQIDLFSHGVSHKLHLLTINPDPVLVMDLFGKIVACNQAAAELLQTSIGALLGQDVEDFIPVQCQSSASHNRRFNSKNSFRVKTRTDAITTRNNTIPVEVHLGFADVDKKSYMVASIKDISDQISIEESLRLAEKRFNETIEYLAVGACHVSLSGIFLMVNQALVNFLGYSKNDLLNTYFTDISHPDDASKNLAQAQAMREGKLESYRTEKRYRHKKGHYLWAQLTVSLVRNHQGQPEYFLSIIENINSKKIFEQLLKDSELKFRTIVESVSNDSVVWMGTPNLDAILYVNEGYEKIWGRDGDTLYHSPESFLELVHPDDKERVLQHIKFDRRCDWEIDYRIIRDDGELRYILDRGYTVEDNGELRLMVGMARDVTKEIVQKNMLIDALQEVKKANDRLTIVSKTDALTNVLNRQAIQQEAQKEMKRYKRYREKSTIVFIDLNDFKLINDSYGHLAGDCALKHCATKLKEYTRETDSVGRYGGDEFVIILPNTNFKEAKSVIDKLHKESFSFNYEDHTIAMGLSLGIAEIDDDIADEREWFKSADIKMYEHKHTTKHTI